MDEAALGARAAEALQESRALWAQACSAQEEELKKKEEEAAAARKAQLSGENPPDPKKVKKTQKVKSGKTGKSGGMMSFDEGKDEDDVF